MDKRKAEICEAIIEFERERVETFPFRIYKRLKMNSSQFFTYTKALEKLGIITKKKDKYSDFNLYSVNQKKYAKSIVTERVTKAGIPLEQGETVAQKAEKLGIKPATLYARIKAGWKFVDGKMIK